MKVIRAVQGDTIDSLCHRYYGYTAGVTESVLKANPNLSELGPVLPMGTKVTMPAVEEKSTRTTIQLWS